MAFDDNTTYAPLMLFEYDHQPGNYCLMMSDNHMVGAPEAVFEANGRQGHGYGWTDLAVCAIRELSPELEDRVDFDPEAGTFVAYGEDLDALKALGAILHGLYHDHDRLGPLVKKAPWDWD